MILWTSLQTPYETSLRRPEEAPDAVHLTHLTTPESIYHLRLGFASLASRPQASKWLLVGNVACDILVHDGYMDLW
ncbi:hypothetical protein ACSBR1_017429 [Camellia fascicularis]